jgi:hypothetical protein
MFFGLRHSGYTIYLLQENFSCIFVLDILTCFFNFCKDYFRWDPLHEAAIRDIFDTKAANIVRHSLYDLRAGRTKVKFMGVENYQKMEVKWEAEEYKAKRVAAEAARMSSSGKGKSAYTGGSVSTAVHRSRLVSIVISVSLCCCVLTLKTNK